MQFVYRVTSLLFSLFFFLFYRVKVVGKWPKLSQGAIVAVNHLSFFDPPLVSAMRSPRSLHFLARSSLFSQPFLGWFLPLLNTHPIDSRFSLESLRRVVSLVQRGQQVVLFPEGERSFNGKLQSGKRGLGLIVSKARCPIIPIYIQGTFEAWNRNQKRPCFFRKIVCHIGEPIEYRKNPALSARDFQMAIVNEVMDRLQWLKAASSESSARARKEKK